MQSLQIERDFFKASINQSSDAIFVIQPHTGRFLFANEKACGNLGRSLAELCSMKVYDIAANVRDPEAWEDHVALVEREGHTVFETEQRRKDGSWFPVEVSTRLLTCEGEKFLISVARDISERRRAAAELVAEKNKLESVLSALGDGLTVQDRGFRILYQNAIHLEKQGDHVGELCYKAYQNRDSICPGCVLEKCFRDGRIHRRETSARRGDKRIHMEVSACPLRDADGKIVAGVEVVRDITRQKQLEAELRNAQKMEAIGTLAGGIAHDFNNILFAMLGNAEMAMRKLDLENPVQIHLAEVVRAGQRASALVKQILTFSRRTEKERVAVSLREVIDEVLQLVRTTLPPNIKVRQFIDEGCRPVFADISQMHQMVMNLAVNAFHAMRADGGTMEFDLEEVEVKTDSVAAPPALKPGLYARLDVHDTGHGMDRRTVERIFDPYFTTREASGGTGLGLASVHGIVKGHGGHIEVASEPGRGTVFSVFLPLYLGENSDLPGGAAPTAPWQTISARILFVDDEEMLAQLAEEALGGIGCTVTAVTNSLEALSLFSANPSAFDLVITDQSMPNLTGMDLAEKMLALRPDLPIILCTGYAEDVSRETALKAGIRELLMKPFSFADFSSIIREVLPGRGALAEG